MAVIKAFVPDAVDRAEPLTVAAAYAQCRAAALAESVIGAVGLEIESHLVDLDHVGSPAVANAWPGSAPRWTTNTARHNEREPDHDAYPRYQRQHTDVSRCHVLDAIAPDGNVFGECQEAIEANGARN